jgi:alginate O-acetyltransferase complex protein AlgI
MLFNTFNFFIFIFFLLVFFNFIKIFCSKNNFILNLILLLFSFFFYCWWSINFAFILILNVTLNYYFAKFSFKYKNNKILILGVILNLFFLGYFKYKNFFLENLIYLFSFELVVREVILPLGISFFTFKNIYFLLENQKINLTKQYSLIHYLTYIIFFPHLISGPLSKPSEILPQLKFNLNKNNLENLIIGSIIFFIGLFKKTILADTFQIYTTEIFSIKNENYTISFIEAWLAIISYTFQIYFDFSGYTDMATGLARMFGVIFPINFFSPYKATSIIEFWRKWHISFSNFLKEVIYIPLGGNRKGQLNTYFFILITMGVGGLWHGASWNFIAWGIFNGLLIILNHLIRKQLILNKNVNCALALFKRLFVFFIINISWIFFSATDPILILNFLKGAFGLNGLYLPDNLAIYIEKNFLGEFINFKNIYYYGKSQIFMILLGFIIVFLLPNTFQITENFNPVLNVKQIRNNFKIEVYKGYFKFKYNIINGILYSLITLLAILAISDTSKEFIYYQF